MFTTIGRPVSSSEKRAPRNGHPWWTLMRSPSLTTGHSAKAEPLQVLQNARFELVGLGELLLEFRHQAFHFHVEELLVLILRSCANVPTRREHMPILPDLF